MTRRAWPSTTRIRLASMPCRSDACTTWAMVEAADVIGFSSPEYVPASVSSANSVNSGGRIAAMPWAKGTSSRPVTPSARASARACV